MPADLCVGERIQVSLRVEDVAVMRAKPECPVNVLSGTVERVSFRGGSSDCHVRVSQSVVRARLDRDSPANRGDRVWLSVDPARVMIFRSRDSE
jgi:ABC-type Fe3+/spermidine/putrescine transport system ATPase subunit